MVPRVLSREVTLMQAVQAGLFTPPRRRGTSTSPASIQTLEAAGYQGWYVIEQDTAITDGLPAEGEGPVDRRCATSLDYLRDVVAPSLAPDP